MAMATLEQIGDVLSRIPEGARVVASGNFATPQALIDVLDRSVPVYTLHMLNAHGDLPDRDGVTMETAFLGPSMRGRVGLRYVPCRLSMVPLLYNGPMPPDVVLVHTSTPHDGRVSLGIEVNVMPAAIGAARARGALVIGMMNPHMPYLFGDAEVLIEHFDYLVEVEQPIPSATPHPPDDRSVAIADHVAHRIDHGATLQMGIGTIPDAVLLALTGHRRLMVWTEMFSDGVMALEQAGAMSTDHPLVASFLFGSSELYEWINRNPRIRMLRTEKTNDPALISRHPRMVSVNSAMQVDLYGQANASTRGTQIYSGFGGQTDFIIGAMHAPAGQAFIALPSWHEKSDTSTIVDSIHGRVTSFQQTAVVTEQGIADLWGGDQVHQVFSLINNAAHPRARAHLHERARQMGLFND
jgi:acyl-CoA hydrolase